jgi:hypothetical protein
MEVDMGKAAVTMRDLQKMSAAAIKSLLHAVPITSGDETVGMLMPLHRPDPERMKAVLDRIEEHYNALPEDSKQWLERFLEERER